MQTQLVIFLICTIRLGYIMYILGHAVQSRESRGERFDYYPPSVF